MTQYALLLFFCHFLIKAQCLFTTATSSNPNPFASPTFRLRAGGSSSTEKSTVPLRPAIDYDGDGTPERVLILMDGFCPYHGGYLAARAKDIPGVAIIHVLSDYLLGYLEHTPEAASDNEVREHWRSMRYPRSPEEIREWKRNLPASTKLVGVYCESDSGLADAEQLRQLLQVECLDEPIVHEARRNKYIMQETIKAAGLAGVTQKLCQSMEETLSFAKHLLMDQERVVLKPFRGVASESVFLCQTIKEVQDAWEKITSTSIFGSAGRHENVLVQEFLPGVEYAVDVVSRNGHHKVAAIWRYDKRPANGAAFCYFKTELVDAEMDENVLSICDYVDSALTALGVKWGLSHTEVIVTPDKDRGPVLVEVNCRQHNMDFCPLNMACMGYNALDVALIAYLGEDEDWMRVPELPQLHTFGCMVHLVNYASGNLKQTFHVQEMSQLESVLDYEVYEQFLTPGEKIEPTVDIRSDAGWVQLINADREKLDQDYSKILAWMPKMFECSNSD
jgi:hypothetical protein